MTPVRRSGPRAKSGSPAAGSSSRGRQRTTRSRPTTAARKANPPGRGLRERNRGIQDDRPGREASRRRGAERRVAPKIGGGKRPGEDVVRDPGKPRPDEPAESED